MHFKIYVINLNRATERLAVMQKKFNDLNLPFERIEAVDGRAMTTEQKQAFASLRPRANGWLPGAIGCFRSHHKVWTAIAEGEEEFGVVFEDDVHISSKLPALLDGIGACLGTFDILRLEATKHRVLLDNEKSFQIGDTKLVEVKSETWCTGAYVLPKKTAKLLLSEPAKNHSPADFFLFDKGTSVVARRNRVYQTIPAVCVQFKFDVAQSKPEASFGSAIEHNSEDSALRHVIRKIGWRINGLKNMMMGYRRIALSEDIMRTSVEK